VIKFDKITVLLDVSACRPTNFLIGTYKYKVTDEFVDPRLAFHVSQLRFPSAGVFLELDKNAIVIRLAAETEGRNVRTQQGGRDVFTKSKSAELFLSNDFIMSFLLA
jgi:hypothetical protein